MVLLTYLSKEDKKKESPKQQSVQTPEVNEVSSPLLPDLKECPSPLDMPDITEMDEKRLSIESTEEEKKYMRINNLDIEIKELYFPFINESERITPLRSSRKLSIVHTQHDSLISQSKEQTTVRRKSNSFYFTNNIKVGQQKNYLTVVSSYFTNQSVFAKALMELKKDPRTENYKLLYSCIYYPRVLYKIIPDEESTFLLKYFNVLIHERKLFVKICKCINFQSEDSLDKIKLITSIDIKDFTMEEALELLCLNHPILREIGVKILEKIPLKEVELFLFIIIQTLRYEAYEDIKEKRSKLMNYLLDISKKSFHISNKLNWYLSVERESEKNKTISNIFSHFQYYLTSQMDKIDIEILKKQQKFVDSITNISKFLESIPKDRIQKQEILNQILDGSTDYNLSICKWSEIFDDAFFLPINTTIVISGFQKGESKIFKSQMAPLLLPMDKCSVIFKKGDDLRQDQLITFLIRFLDDCLNAHNLDLFLTPYHIMSTSMNSGFLEFIPDSYTVGSIIKDYPNGIKDFLMKHNSKNGVLDKEVITRYIKSCAGYSVITYLLGIGDRHLDNLLITKNGTFFHIDFGYILGQDPKPFPPKMRLSKEMVDGFGGISSTEFAHFQILCCSAFKILRKYSNYILTIFNVMLNGNLPHITSENLQYVLYQNFKLELDDDEAHKYMMNIITDSMTRLMPQINEKFHEIAQSFKK